MKTIAVTGGKGGTGKSTVAASLAVTLAGKMKVLLADADVECPNDHLMLDIKRSRLRKVYQPVPEWDFAKCTQCGRCAAVCKQNAIVAVKGKNPAFVPDLCIGCKACMVACPVGAIGESKKQIGTVFKGKGYGVDLVSGELKLGQLASGEIVVETRKDAARVAGDRGSDVVLVDSAAGVGCPVIASIQGADLVIAVTEPTPSGFEDLKRVLYISDHFRIPRMLIINKSDLDEGFCRRIEEYAKDKGIPILGKMPYRKSVVLSTVGMKPICMQDKHFGRMFRGMAGKVSEFLDREGRRK